MKPLRFVFAFAALLCVSAISTAQETPPAPPKVQLQPIPQPPPPPPPPQVLGNPLGLGDLISPAGLEKLALSKEQKADFDKINDEFKKSQKELQTKLANLTKNPGQAPDPNAFREIFEAQQKLRPSTLDKVEKLLTDEQKKTLEQIRREIPGFGIGFGPGPGPGPFGFPPPMPFGPQVGGAFLPADAQQRLKLTDEQKKKIDDLQKDLEAKILSVLTDDQKKMFEELKKNRVGPPIGGFFPAPPPPPPPPPPGIGVPPPPPPVVDPAKPPEVKKN